MWAPQPAFAAIVGSLLARRLTASSCADNHHHGASIVGKSSKMQEMDVDEAAAKGLRGHLLSGGQKVWVPVEHEPSVSMAACRFFSDDHAHQDHAGRLLVPDKRQPHVRALRRRERWGVPQDVPRIRCSFRTARREVRIRCLRSKIKANGTEFWGFGTARPRSRARPCRSTRGTAAR